MRAMPKSGRKTSALVAGFVAAALTLSACGSGSSGGAASKDSSGKVNVSLTQFSSTFATLLEYVANRKGFFADNGLNVKIVQVANGSAASQALLSGSVDMSTNSVYEILTARSKGEQLQYVAGGVKGGFGEIVTLPSLSVPHKAAGFPGVIQDLKGKKIGVSSIGGGTYYELLFLLQKAGMKPTDVTIVPTGAISAAFAALKAKQVDAIMSQEPVTTQVTSNGSAQVIYSLGAGPNPPAGSENLMANGVVATTKFINANPAAVKDVNAAIKQANTYLMGLDQAGAAQLATVLAPDLPGIPASVVAKAVLSYKDHYDADMAPEGIDIANQQLVAGKLIPSPVSYTSVVNSIAQEK